MLRLLNHDSEFGAFGMKRCITLEFDLRNLMDAQELILKHEIFNFCF